MKILTVLLLALSVSAAFGQVRSHKKKNSTAAGTLYFYWGYNRSYYTHSTIRFVGPEYDFKMRGVAASDRPDKFDPAVYFNPTTITVPQYNARIGYYFTDKWSLSFGVDHFKYVMNDRNDVLLDGFIGMSADSSMAGNYSDESFITDRDRFHYENTNGCNFLRFELARSFDIFELGDRRQVALTALAGASIGPALTFNDLNFGGRHTFATVSLSGYGASLNGGLRLEFFRHFFLQMNTGLGMFHLVHVRTRPDDRNSFARQAFGYSEYNAAAGFLLYLRPKNGCDTCPHW
jgi:hypothetical protein